MQYLRGALTAVRSVNEQCVSCPKNQCIPTSKDLILLSLEFTFNKLQKIMFCHTILKIYLTLSQYVEHFLPKARQSVVQHTLLALALSLTIVDFNRLYREQKHYKSYGHPQFLISILSASGDRLTGRLCSNSAFRCLFLHGE